MTYAGEMIVPVHSPIAGGPFAARRSVGARRDLSDRALMRPRVEAGGLQVSANLRERLSRARQRQPAFLQQPIDVEGPEADALHVERRDRPGQGFTFVDQPVASLSRRLRLDYGEEVVNAGLGGCSGIACTHDRDTNLAELAGIINGRAGRDTTTQHG